MDRTLLENVAAEGYRNEVLSESEVMRMLGLPSRFAVHEWLSLRRIPYRYSETDLAQDLACLTDLGLR